MRIAAIFLYVLIIAFGFASVVEQMRDGRVTQLAQVAGAPVSPKGSKTACVAPGYEEKKRYGAGSESYMADAKKGIPNAAKSTISLCSNQELRMDTNWGKCTLGSTCYAEVVVKTTRPCCTDADKKKYGCGRGQTEPKLTYVDDKTKKKITISKCNKDLLKAIGDEISEQSLKQLSDLEKADQIRIAEIAKIPSVGILTEHQRELLKSFGITEEQTKTLATKAPAETEKLLACLAVSGACNATEAQIAATLAGKKAGIEFNKDTLNNFAYLTSEQPEITNTVPPPDELAPPDTTFTTQTPQPLKGGVYAQKFNEIEKRFGLPEGFIAETANLESRGNCNARAGISSASGCFQYTEKTWAIDSKRLYGYSLPSNLRFDPEISATVFASATKHYMDTQKPLIETAVERGLPLKTALFQFHNLGIEGGPRFLRAFAQDPHQPVWNVLTPTEIRNNPGLYGNGSISLLQAGHNVYAKMNGGNTNFTGSFFAQNPWGSTMIPQTSGSPFAFLSSRSGLTSTYGAAPQYAYMGGTAPPPPYVAQQIGYPGGTGAPASGYTQPIGSQTPLISNVVIPPINPVLTLAPASTTVKAGNKVTLAWSAVGVSACVFGQTKPTSKKLLDGVEGLYRFQTMASTTKGTYEFALRCAASKDGSMTEKKSTVLVQ